MESLCAVLGKPPSRKDGIFCTSAGGCAFRATSVTGRREQDGSIMGQHNTGYDSREGPGIIGRWV